MSRMVFTISAVRAFTSSVTWKSSCRTFSTSTMSTSPGPAAGSTASPACGRPPGSSSASFLPRFGFRRAFCLFSGSASSGSTSSCRLMWTLLCPVTIMRSLSPRSCISWIWANVPVW